MNEEELEDGESLLSAQEILEVDDHEFAVVDVPEWNGKVRIRALTAGEVLKFTQAAKSKAHKGAIRILVMSAVDANGEKLFKDEAAAEKALLGKNIKGLLKVQDAAIELNGFQEAVEEYLKKD